MASSSILSDVFAVASLLVVSALVLLLLRHFLPLRSAPAYLLVPVFLALALPCSIILLVPIDLASADGGSVRGVWLPERVVLVTWRITYWLTFLLTWFLLPFLGEYVDSGYREPKNRAIYSLRRNAQYNLIMIGVGIAGLVYFVLQNGFHGASIKGMIMALAYAWGLILAIALMGHGLVAFPRRLLKNASVGTRLRRLQSQAPKIKDTLDDASESLEQLENTVIQLKQRKNGTPRDLQEWVDELADPMAGPELRPGAAAAVRSTNVNIPAVVTERYLADLTRKVKRARHRKTRFTTEWKNLCQRAQETQMILDAATTQSLDFGKVRPGEEGIMDRFNFLTPSMRYQLHAKAIPWLRIGVACFFAAASVMVIWSEVVRSFAPKISVIGLTVIHHPNSTEGKVGFAGQVIAAAWLLYMDACALYAISDVKVWGNRALVKRATYAESATWYSLQVAKLTVPLSYNFITMLPPAVFRGTAFYGFLGQLINLTPLGSGFSAFFPLVILLPVMATLFNLYGKAKNVIGIGVLEDESEDNPSGFGTGGWREGRALIDRELQSHGEGNVGLTSRSSSPNPRTANTNTATPSSATRRQRDPDPVLPSHVQDANRQFHSVTNQAQPAQQEEDNSARHFYQDLSERVANTFDSVERPEWLRDIGSGFQAPKWMQSDGSGQGPGAGISRWFGGRAEDGRLRL